MSNLQYIDQIDYESIKAPETQSDLLGKFSGEEIIDKYNFTDSIKKELLEEIDNYINAEVTNITLEFISRFFERLGKGSKEAFSISRALGFHIYLKDKDGKEIHTLKEISEYWGVCPQLMGMLAKQVQEDLNFDPIQNLAIHKKDYCYKVKSPKGYMTTIEVMKFLDLSNKKLNGAVKALGIKKKDYTRGSKLIAEEDVDKIELYFMEGK